MVAPQNGTPLEIRSYKHNGSLHRVWEKTLVLNSTKTTLIGANDKTLVTESDGKTWRTREPAICYFSTKHWYNIIGMIRPSGIHYYCNISSPCLYEYGALKYIDYDLDVKVFPDRTIKILDEDEYELHKKEMQYPHGLDEILYHHVNLLKQQIHQQKGPFAPGFIDYWYERFLTYRF